MKPLVKKTCVWDNMVLQDVSDVPIRVQSTSSAATRDENQLSPRLH
jgi:hypothetical protein